jgi:propanol-preferring alcohol dehydrogenase
MNVVSLAPRPMALAMTSGSATVERNIARRCWTPRATDSPVGGLSSMPYSTSAVPSVVSAGAFVSSVAIQRGVQFSPITIRHLLLVVRGGTTVAGGPTANLSAPSARDMVTMDAVVLDEWGGSLDVAEVDRPDPGPGEVLVDVRACGVTRTVENAVQGGLSDDPTLTPRIPGHEFAGVVEAVGDGVTDWTPGDRALAYFYLTCGRCDRCRRGRQNQCVNFDGWLGVQREGAYAEYASVPARSLLPLPEDATFAEGAVAADGLATPLHVCERTDVDDTDTVLVVGAAGRIGVHLAQLAASRGAHVLAADVDDDRLAYVDALTSDAVTPIDARGDDFAARARDATRFGEGPTVAVDTVGDIDTLRDAWDALAMGGDLVTLTTHHERSFDPQLAEFVVTEASLVGSRYATMDQVVRAARLLADGRVDADYTEKLGLEAVADYHAAIRAGDTHGMAVLEP